MNFSPIAQVFLLKKQITFFKKKKIIYFGLWETHYQAILDRNLLILYWKYNGMPHTKVGT